MEYRFYNLSPDCYLRFLKRKKPALNGSKPTARKTIALGADFDPAKSPFDFKRSLKKALSGAYDGLLFGESFLENKNFDFLFAREPEKQPENSPANKRPQPSKPKRRG